MFYHYSVRWIVLQKCPEISFVWNKDLAVCQLLEYLGRTGHSLTTVFTAITAFHQSCLIKHTHAHTQHKHAFIPALPLV